MTSHPPGACCYAGVKHEGTPSGEMKSVGDVETYFAYPPDKTSTKKGILFLTDAMGLGTPNSQLLADQFAANGYLVLVPDLFYGDPIPLQKLRQPGDFDIMAWLTKGGPKGSHLPPTVDPIIDACLVEMRTVLGCDKIGAVGYCFGGKYVVRHLRPDQGKVDVGYIAHPSFVDKEELQEIKGPLAIGAAETDEIFPSEKRHESEEILKAVKQPYQINLYSGVVHGFAVRCDKNVQQQRFAMESTFLQACAWFDEYLK